ncbi:MAG: Erwinia chrysanthemi phospholipase C (plcA) [uncultured Thermomicrobiales bacterium]|uniref:Erwinia chrysanthemi phospholipase C (PlcA) n=1 Tax=uncultured Thermomicrobiales bacterium TaxID=1645740 RepID=A0A6J4V1V6_9BACT|nr:MAG: Erwinia chrysanthemi phospholipase C (plcA) [uncultured Thermomicrobiales bacterium]
MVTTPQTDSPMIPATSGPTPTCGVIRPGSSFHGKQGLTYGAGIAAETTGSVGICMHLLTIPPGGRAKAHLHRDHETAIYVLSGECQMAFGEDLTERLTVHAGEFLYIPAGVPHLPMNIGTEPCMGVLARTDPNEQESVELRPDLEGHVPI